MTSAAARIAADQSNYPKGLNAWLYCHHCERFDEQKPRGEIPAGDGCERRHSFECSSCGERITIPWYPTTGRNRHRERVKLEAVEELEVGK